MSTTNLIHMPPPKPEKKKRKKNRVVRGEGHLFLRGATYWMELNWKGARFRRSLETTDLETARIKQAEEVRAIRSGEMPKTFEPITCQAMFDAFILRAENDCKASTVEDYRRRWAAHLRTFFAGLFATQVNKQRVTEYINRRMKEGASVCTRNREQRVLMMAFEHNRSSIPADHFPEFPKMPSEKQFTRTGRLADDDYETLCKRLDDPRVFWLKVFLVMTFKHGFRKAELLGAKCSYFDPKASTFTLPAYSTKNKTRRVVTISPNGDIFKMLVALVDGRDGDTALFIRNGRPVRDFRAEWAKQTAGMRGGSGKGGTVTIHDLKRSAVTNMNEKGIDATKAGTHLTAEVFARYIQRNEKERRATAALIES